MFSRSRKHLTPFTSGDETDALYGKHGHAPLCIYDQPGIRKKTKQRYNRRVRRLHKTEILNRGEE